VTVRWRLTLWYGAVLAVALAGFGAAVFFVVRHEMLERIDRGLSEELADVLSEVGRAKSEERLSEWLERRFAGHQGFDFQITRPGGERFFSNRRLAGATLPLPEGPLTEAPSYRNVHTGEGRWRVVSVRARGPGDELTVQVARRLGDFDHELRELLLALLLAGPLALAAAVGGGYFLAGRALAPVDLLRRRTREITADRLDQRLPVPNPGDELGLLAQTINDMIARLERSFAEVRRFTADASHELRTPLTAIRTEAEVALGRGVAGPEQRQLLGSILEECERLSRLTDQLLALAREDAGVSPPASETVDLAALLNGVTETMRALADARGVRLVANADGPLVVPGDETRLRLVLYNLLDNALKHTPPGGLVEARAERREAGAVVTVQDTGEGIPPEHLPRVFDRFYRVDKARSRAQGGTGLGLSIVKSAVEAHGGTVELNSAPGQGTTVRVVLPPGPGGGGLTQPQMRGEGS
jgi:heavy metal sensor kinase